MPTGIMCKSYRHRLLYVANIGGRRNAELNIKEETKTCITRQ
ncbi:MAG: hypothetical protein WCA45_15105 [Thiobacillaceae bacterium]